MGKLVSIIMSTFNESEKILTESISSVLNQSYQNIELIIVNDNPSNIQLKSILNKYKTNPQITIIENPKNLGAALSRNQGLKIAKGSYIAILDSDDVALPERISKQVNYLESHPSCTMVASNRNSIDENSKFIGKSDGIVISDKKLFKIMKYCSVITHSTVLTRAHTMKELGGYRPLPAAQDYDMMLRLLSQKQELHIMPEALVNFRVRAGGITNGNFAKQYFCSKYARRLFKERLEQKGKDSFSKEDLDKILNTNSIKFKAINSQQQQINAIKSNKNLLKNIFLLIAGTLSNFENLRNMVNSFFIKILLRF